MMDLVVILSRLSKMNKKQCRIQKNKQISLKTIKGSNKSKKNLIQTVLLILVVLKVLLIQVQILLIQIQTQNLNPK